MKQMHERLLTENELRAALSAAGITVSSIGHFQISVMDDAASRIASFISAFDVAVKKVKPTPRQQRDCWYSLLTRDYPELKELLKDHPRIVAIRLAENAIYREKAAARVAKAELIRYADYNDAISYLKAAAKTDLNAALSLAVLCTARRPAELTSTKAVIKLAYRSWLCTARAKKTDFDIEFSLYEIDDGHFALLLNQLERFNPKNHSKWRKNQPESVPSLVRDKNLIELRAIRLSYVLQHHSAMEARKQAGHGLTGTTEIYDHYRFVL